MSASASRRKALRALLLASAGAGSLLAAESAHAQTAGPAYKGAVTHPGGKAEVKAYADL